MGQVALGLRSLAIKLAVFFLLAALLAWILGGSLFPRRQGAVTTPVRFDDADWYWRWRASEPRPLLRWELMRQEGEESLVFDDGPWAEVGPLLTIGDALYYAARPEASATSWRLARLGSDLEIEWTDLPDRLEVERQLARLQRGLPMQSAETIHAQRERVLDPDATASVSDEPTG